MIKFTVNGKKYKDADSFSAEFCGKRSKDLLQDAIDWYMKGDYNTTTAYYNDKENDIVRQEGTRVFKERRNRILNNKYTLRENILIEAYEFYIEDTVQNEYDKLEKKLKEDNAAEIKEIVEGYEFKLSRNGKDNKEKRYRVITVPEYFCWTNEGDDEDEGYLCDDWGYSYIDCNPKTLSEIRQEIRNVIIKLFGDTDEKDKILDKENWFIDDSSYIFDGEYCDGVWLGDGVSLSNISFAIKEEGK